MINARLKSSFVQKPLNALSETAPLITFITNVLIQEIQINILASQRSEIN